MLSHPAMAFMHAFTTAWCETTTAHSQPTNTWLTTDFELGSHDGRRFTGCEIGARAFIESLKLYETSTVEIESVYLEETEAGYTGLAMGRVFAKFKGEEQGEKGGKCVDSQGREWDLSVPRAYDCTFVRDEEGPVGGLKLKKMLVCGDMQPVVVEARKRGLI
ncbi:hypothetical protein B0T16DRAFT_418140 [Cercophora newfieldiana]|uniref:Uncharacterized protein n=1 Tax=Cercophora newfieldiana TaxID=92897 RepID=A0AA40CIX4_9PEZI|nr:hypothetical protein B0T16DRAFT_418140 [Cercophora newfieldiana]